MNDYAPQTAEEYIQCFRALASLADKATTRYSEKKDWVSMEDRAKALSRLRELIEAVSLLRGDGGVLVSFRPQGLDQYQGEMYTTEDALWLGIKELEHLNYQ
jgi:hypothetical protein